MQMQSSLKRWLTLLTADKSRRYVVPSAPGKRNDKDEKVTDLLYACYDAAASGQRLTRRSWRRSKRDTKRSLTDWI